MKKIYLTLLISILVSINSFSQIPEGYYNTATGTNYTLKTQLHNIIDGHTTISYSGLWTAFYTTDADANGYVWDIYSDCHFTFGTDQDDGTQPANECSLYNREHSFPKAWFGGEVSPMYTELFHIYPTSKTVNSLRANLPYGQTNSPSTTTDNGSKVGPCSYTGYTGTIFEPIDEYKGDLARTYFYMATRYENVISSWTGSPMLDGSSDKCFTTWALNMLLEWTQNDPVSQKEIDRNNAIYDIQNNRNPYIDHPEWVECVWNGNCGVNINKLYSNNVQISPNPVINNITIKSSEKIYKYLIFNALGQVVFNDTNVNNNNIFINLSSLKSGFYFIRITDINGNIDIQKVVKQ